jgi:Asp-tRNA(Asn)/Glu-tRNA(Gln) amidotransferase A subunit family amidase
MMKREVVRNSRRKFIKTTAYAAAGLVASPAILRETAFAVSESILVGSLHASRFDVTGHPAMSLPCGTSQGLPIGLMLVAKDYDESTIYPAASAFEASYNWKKL